MYLCLSNIEHSKCLQPADQVHGEWLALLKGVLVGRALDVGAGSGWDSRELDALGWNVTAIEPAEA